MFNNWRYKLQQFMVGRYGMDQFGRFLSTLTIVLIFIDLFTRSQFFHLLVLALIIYMYFRVFSRNIAKRYAENQKYLELSSGVRTFFRTNQFPQKVSSFFRDLKYNVTHFKENREKNKGYHIYKCPQCKQKIRIPKGKGHIIVRCPKCGFEFHKRS